MRICICLLESIFGQNDNTIAFGPDIALDALIDLHRFIYHAALELVFILLAN